ncbi:hypothetical protein AVEN_34527-1 [Araneus ventricosus]|uniref:Uncharacterized protein n=1 Tax=Araneus ventricosus TaxID=182803 RepID=A0A4Y2LKQ6_ARAVE|nr:hypothetical protein AVEN_34527-1 [Araneus ventricosus]
MIITGNSFNIISPPTLMHIPIVFYQRPTPSCINSLVANPHSQWDFVLIVIKMKIACRAKSVDHSVLQPPPCEQPQAIFIINCSDDDKMMTTYSR